MSGTAGWTRFICLGVMTNTFTWSRASICPKSRTTCFVTIRSTRPIAAAPIRILMNNKDEKMFEWVRKFNPYDLYSKGLEKPNLEADHALLSGFGRQVFPRSNRLVRLPGRSAHDSWPRTTTFRSAAWPLQNGKQQLHRLFA